MTRYLKQYKFLLFLTVLFTAISSLSYVFIAILLQQVSSRQGVTVLWIRKSAALRSCFLSHINDTRLSMDKFQ